MTNRLLIVSCSQRKKCAARALPAIERYDGPIFRLLRRYLRDSSENLAIYVLSAEFGLIPHHKKIPYYDRHMTQQRARELLPHLTKQIHRLFGQKNEMAKTNEQLLICMSKLYLQTFRSAALQTLSSYVVVRTANGLPGRKLSMLYDWLYGEESKLQIAAAASAPTGTAKLHGVTITLTHDQVFDAARQFLTDGTKASASATKYHSWYVPVDHWRLSPKWLISQIAGLPVSAFHTDEARRVLNELGVQVIRV